MALIFKNLLRNLCPACDEPLEQYEQPRGMWFCSNRTCSYRVGNDRKAYLVGGMQPQKPKQTT